MNNLSRYSDSKKTWVAEFYHIDLHGLECMTYARWCRLAERYYRELSRAFERAEREATPAEKNTLFNQTRFYQPRFLLRGGR